MLHLPARGAPAFADHPCRRRHNIEASRPRRAPRVLVSTSAVPSFCPRSSRAHDARVHARGPLRNALSRQINPYPPENPPRAPFFAPMPHRAPGARAWCDPGYIPSRGGAIAGAAQPATAPCHNDAHSHKIIEKTTLNACTKHRPTPSPPRPAQRIVNARFCIRRCAMPQSRVFALSMHRWRTILGLTPEATQARNRRRHQPSLGSHRHGTVLSRQFVDDACVASTAEGRRSPSEITPLSRACAREAPAEFEPPKAARTPPARFFSPRGDFSGISKCRWTL